MRFGAWYPLGISIEGSLDSIPAGEGVLQLRLATGLVEYPLGKSAMVWYQHASNVRAEVIALAATHATRPIHATRDLVCRHLIEIDDATDLVAFCAKLRAEFVRRFGAPPLFETR